MKTWSVKIAATFLAVLVVAGSADAADRGKAPPNIPCGLGMVHNSPGPTKRSLLVRASYRQIDSRAVKNGQVRVTFVGHSTFAIETAGGAMAATDYFGLRTPGRLPDIVTMNNSHESHYTDFVDPAVKYVLRGWDPAGGIARHHLKYKDMRVYNLPTNIFDTGKNATNGNSVFVFEAAGICFAHLGHLHHFLSKEQVARLGRIDVLFVPIDGIYTLSHAEAMHIIGRIQPRVVMPMHMQSFGAVYEFPEIAGKNYKIVDLKKGSIDINRASLPHQTEVWFLTEDLSH